MPSLRAVQLPAIEEEPDTSVEAVIVAAIRLHECIEASLRRLAAEDVHAPRVASGQWEVWHAVEERPR